MSKLIPLSKGFFAVIDDEDFELVSQFKWHEDNGYAVCVKYIAPHKNKTILMHRLVMNAPSDLDVDHKNHNPLDNQKVNLRLATHHQNMQNFPVRKDNVSGYKGVRKQKNRWRARIRVNGKLISLGYFDTPEDAARAYNRAASVHFGEFAWLNPV